MGTALTTRLDQHCAMLLEQEPCRMEKRRRLVQQQQVLQVSLKELLSVQQVGTQDDMDLA
jgi:hypothetical protein